MNPLPPRLSTMSGRSALLDCYQQGLLQETIPFWFPHCVDEAYGGYLHCRDRDGSLVDTDKSVWAQGRMAWMLFSLYNTIEPRSEWLNWGESGLNFLRKHCFDDQGRMFFHVTRDGKPIRQRRYAYSEAFAAIAFAAHYRATGEERSARQARELFDLSVRWNFEPGQMPAKFTAERPMIGMGPRMITLVTAQELRAHLGPDPIFSDWIDRCCDQIERLFVQPQLQAVLETVAPDGSVIDHFDGRLLNPGHAIEGSWFLMEEGRLRGNQHWIELGCTMLDWMWERGWDNEHGGLFYFRDLYDKPVQEYWAEMKFWWPHNEAVLATLLAYRLTGNLKYAQWHEQVHNWSYQHFADPKHGEWFGYLHRDGRLANTLKGNLWKSFFHFPRMQWQASMWLQNWSASGD